MATPDRYAVIGHPISHSQSPVIHSQFAQDTGQNIVYEAIDVASDQLETMLARFAEEGGCGLNVTVPHKQAVLMLMDNLTERAKLAGAVNTITCKENGKLEGDNTDGVGLIKDLRDNLSVKLSDVRVLILGAGGATRGIIPPILEQQPAQLVIANRTESKAHNLAARFTELGKVSGCSLDSLHEHQFNLIINATSAGLAETLPAFTPSILGAETVCYDLSYSTHDTPFVAWAKKHDCAHTYQGWGMLVEQAAEAFYIWRGVRPPTSRARQLL